METILLFLLVFVLGMRHGLDADHLACIDGLTRYNWRIGSPIARYVGTLFSLGHGLVVAAVAAILGLISSQFVFPEYFNTIVTWISVISLFIIGTMNSYNLLHKSGTSENFKIQSFKGKLIPRAARETKNPFFIVCIGGAFALAADTISQTSVWALAAGSSGAWMPILLGLTFMVGMVLTDTLDSIITYYMLENSGKMGQTASRALGWFIVGIAYSVSFYQIITFFVPTAEVDFELVGVMIFLVLIVMYGFVKMGSNYSSRVSGEK